MQPTIDAYCDESDYELASATEKESFIEDKPSMSYWQDAWRRFKANKVAMASLFTIIALVIFAFIGPMLSPYDYAEQIRGSENLAPSLAHPFGTDTLGRDNLVRTMFGTRISMIIGAVASLIVLFIGSIYGAISGYFGGVIDNIMMRFVELIYSIPDILIVLLLATVLKQPLQMAFNNATGDFMRRFATLGPSLIAIFIAFGLLYWVGTARIIRGQVLMLKEQEFVTAARALGASNSKIIKTFVAQLHRSVDCYYLSTDSFSNFLRIVSVVFGFWCLGADDLSWQHGGRCAERRIYLYLSTDYTCRDIKCVDFGTEFGRRRAA